MTVSSPRHYSAYLLTDPADLLRRLAAAGVHPRYDRVCAEHVTHRYPDLDPAPPAGTVTVVGHAHRGGVQALLVTVDGTTVRPDGKVYHLTLSLAAGHAPAESHALLADPTAVTRLAPITVAVAAV